MPKHAAIRAPKPLTSHDTNAPINRAPSPRWVENLRNTIQTKNLVHRLQTFALDDPEAPTGPRMTRTQATVALSLLRKVLPDMQALEISGNSEKPLVVQVMRFSDGLVIDADHSGIPQAPVLDVGAEEPSAIDGDESRTNPNVSDVGNGAVPYSGPYTEPLPDAIEHNARLIEDELPKRKAPSRRISTKRDRSKT